VAEEEMRVEAGAIEPWCAKTGRDLEAAVCLWLCTVIHSGTKYKNMC